MNARVLQAGSALMTALFLIFVLIGLGLAMMSLSNVEQDTTAKSELAAKVYYGAKAGLDWGIQQAIASDACIGGSFSPAGAGLSGVTVTVSCTPSSTFGSVSNCGVSGTAACKVFIIASTATAGSLGSLGYAERHMEARVSNIP